MKAWFLWISMFFVVSSTAHASVTKVTLIYDDGAILKFADRSVFGSDAQVKLSDGRTLTLVPFGVPARKELERTQNNYEEHQMRESWAGGVVGFLPTPDSRVFYMLALEVSVPRTAKPVPLTP